jgi:hypothetical protein
MQKTFIQIFFRGDSGERKYEKRKKVGARNEKIFDNGEKPTCLEGVKTRIKYSTTTKRERKLDEFYKKKKKNPQFSSYQILIQINLKIDIIKQ